MWKVKSYHCFEAEVTVANSGSQHVEYECIIVLKLVKGRSYKSPFSAGMNENIAEHGVNLRRARLVLHCKRHIAQLIDKHVVLSRG